jgi:hypothetical protein
MKQINNKQILAAVMTISAGLIMTHSAQAQLIPLSGVNAVEATGAAGAGWLAGSGPAATFASGPSVGAAGTAGIEVQASAENGFGFSYFDLGSGATTINPNATEVTLTFTINGSSTGYNWLGVPLTLNDGTGHGVYNGKYSAPGNPGNQPGTVWNGNTGSITWALNPAEITAIQGGSDTVYGFNTGVDPASVPATYDLTFNSLDFTAVPEPSTLAYSAFGAASIFLFRRRK